MVVKVIAVLSQDEVNAEVLLSVSDAEDNSILSKLLVMALEPIALPSFVSASSLEGRLILLKSLIIDVTGGGIPKASHLKLTLEGLEKDDASPSDAVEDTPAPPSPKSIERRSKALQLTGLGYDTDLCIKALEMSQDNMERAADMLMTGKVQAFIQGSAAEGRNDKRWENAQTIAVISNMPPKLCYSVLEMLNDENNQAVDWLLRYGSTYASISVYADGAARATESQELTDDAVIEDCAEAHIALSDNSAVTSDGSAATTISSSELSVGIRPVDSSELERLRVDSLVVVAPPSSSSSRSNANTATQSSILHFPGAPYVVNEVVRKKKKVSVHVKQVDAETSFVSSKKLEDLKELHLVSSLFNVDVKGLDTLCSLFFQSEVALLSHFSRSAVVTLMSNWPATRNFSLASIGGAVSLVQLVKMVAASEVFLKNRSQGSGDGEGNAGVEVDAKEEGTSTNAPMTDALRAIMLRVLRQEAAERPEGFVEEYAAPPVADDADEDDEEDDEAAALALALQLSVSINEAVKGGKEDVDAEESPHKNADVLRGDTLSQKLVSQCVSNFVESTRPSENSETATKESLHPYFPSCDYSGNVHFEGTKALRVSFDPKSEIGENTRLRVFRYGRLVHYYISIGFLLTQ